MTRFIQLILCILIYSNNLQAQNYFKPFVSNRFDMYLSSEYFSTNSNYDANGSTQSLLTGASLQSLGLNSSIRYLFFDNIGVYTGVNFNNVETNNGFQSRSNSTMTYYSVGIDMLVFKSGFWGIYLDGQYVGANATVDVNTDDAVASDGANEMIAGAVGTFENESWRFFTKVAYDFRTEGFSNLVRYAFGGDYKWEKYFLGLGFEGLSTVQDDEFTATPIMRDLLTTRVNAGSRRYYAVNPNSLLGFLQLQYNINKDINVKVHGGSTVVGSNSAQGMQFGLAMNWGFGVSKKTSTSDSSTDLNSNTNLNNKTEKDSGFKVDTNDGVNQEIFKPTNTPKK